MTTQKAQRKIKSSTVAITVLSILLAIAVVSTIVLAAFSTTRTATTTVTFGGGLTMNLSMTGNSDFNELTSTSEQTVTITPAQSSFSSTVTMPALNAQTSEAAYVGWVITVSGSDSWTFSDNVWTNGTVDVTISIPASDIAAGTADGAYYKETATTAATNFNIFDSIVIDATSDDVNDLAGQTVTISIAFKAETVAGDGQLSNVQS